MIHRDIKPGNILATENCEVCFCDFGFARKFDENDVQKEEYNMTEYVVTRYYRAPEIMLSSQQYTKAVDIWYNTAFYGTVGVSAAPLLS